MISEQTRAEMAAGAKLLADRASQSGLPPGYMEAIVRTHERNGLLTRWEAAGKLRIERVGHLQPDGKTTWSTMYHVTPSNKDLDVTTFTDIDAERVGASPSEVLVANIALALQAAGDA